ncbi:MAG TPA: Wzz/FepE/Etk N-terminal domain-containing protein [Ferruginibacter sp.]|nr:Wzz/FepE/Etk N-terminal domain-containing protein [Ferruginibacter sp.]HMP19699.1 Wzz/FepE/Etk N-terminal domain-containing protein [Ferruginibacter sp.]
MPATNMSASVITTFNLPVIIKFLLKKWLFFVLAGIIGGICGILYAISEKPVYESRLTFALDAGANDIGLSGAMNLAAQFGFGFGSNQSMFEGDNILEILKSRRIIEEVLLSAEDFNGKRYTLAEYYLNISGLKNALAKKAHLKNLSFPERLNKASFSYIQDSVLNNIFLDFKNKHIYAGRPDKKLSVYEIRIKSPDEKFTKVFTDRLIEAASNFYTEITSRKDRETLEILEQRVASLKSNVSSSIDTKASTQDANVNPAFVAAQSPVLKQQFNMQAYGEAYKEMFKTLEMARYQYLKKIPLLQIIDSADYPMRKIKLGKLKTGALFAVAATLIMLLVFWLKYIFRKPTV